MEPVNMPKSLFDRIVDQALDTLQTTNDFDPVLIKTIRKLAREEQLGKSASIVRAIKDFKEDEK